jgi:DNA-binding NarL/FixJ family response regulator
MDIAHVMVQFPDHAPPRSCAPPAPAPPTSHHHSADPHPSERRVTEMRKVAGMTNKQIAQALFVTLRTVELHLSNAYTKLGIKSRQDLGQASLVPFRS